MCLRVRHRTLADVVQPVLCVQSCAIKKKKPSLTTISGAAAELPHVHAVLFS